jgi:hypothetical protein
VRPLTKPSPGVDPWGNPAEILSPESADLSSRRAKVAAASRLAARLASSPAAERLTAYLRDSDPDGAWSTYGQLVTRVAPQASELQIALFGLGGEWAASGARDRVSGVALQIAAAEIFGGSMANVGLWAATSVVPEAHGMLATVGDGLHLVLETVYDLTQNALLDGDGVVLYRGIGSNHVDDLGSPALLPISSWSTDQAVAAHFPFYGTTSPRKVVLAACVPHERIFSIPETGFASLAEKEVAVLGANDEQDRVNVL